MFSIILINNEKTLWWNELDMDMIDKYKWYNKFNMLWKDKIYNFNIKPPNDNMDELLLKEWDLNAIDFHCSNILDYLVKKYALIIEN